MAQKKKLKLKKTAVKPLLIIGILLLLLLLVFFFFFHKIKTLESLGYSFSSSKAIVQKLKWKDVFAVGENKTLNRAFESSDYQENNFKSYTKIKYQNQKDLIQNINLLLEKGYKESEISLILSRGNNDDVTAFAKRAKVKYLEEFFSVSYARLSYYDRYAAYQDLENNDAETTVLYVNLDFDKEEYQDVRIFDTFDKYTLVNKHRMLSEKYIPNNLKAFPKDEVKGTDTEKAHREVVEAFHRMREAALKDGKDIKVNSAYRSWEEQEEIKELYLKAYGQNYVDNYLVRTGYSEHQTGMSIDVASASKNVFLESEEYQWMMDNAHLYGFILRYPKSKEEITSYKCEPWHYRYVGKKIAKYMKDHKLTYDEYYVMFLDK